jgi:AcrB/AcrD/AcrF family
MVPYSAFMTLKKSQGLNEITRYNLYPSAAIQLVPAPGCSTGQAIEAVQQVAEATLPRGYGLGWEGLSWDESKKGNAALYIFLIVVVFVYLVLVAQYESFMIPLADACRVTWQLIEDGRAAEALPFIEPAAQRAPVNATIQEAYAIVLEKVGRDVEARSRHELSKLIRARIDRS